MPTHLYCLVPASADGPTPAGADRIRRIRIGDVDAWVATVDEPRLPRDRRAIARRVVEHDAAIAAALSAGVTPLPAALADPYPDDSAATADIAGRLPEIARLMASVAGLVEMTVVVGALSDTVEPASGAGATGPGRAYLERLHGMPAKLAATADSISLALASFNAPEARRTEDDHVALSHLVARSSVDAYRSIVSGTRLNGVGPIVDGPRAPYSFAMFSPNASSDAAARN